ncbi:hypothetical protein LWF01_07660 [Saxibacter everestensis]|uniref:DUF948 domain-containing protein n=1 Tax=Saxibacter everestensis TaxID=2909229 RepID=A0ABY8QXG7_9MICO|nr:hypothetical protein LWF01_07660 [Brevibacteriaceae bacterium ZFBP1038]
MTWWMWVILWTVLVLAALAILAYLGFTLFRKGVTLMEEVADTGEKLAELTDQVEQLGDASESQAELAIFADPTQLRARRIRDRRTKLRAKQKSSR